MIYYWISICNERVSSVAYAPKGTPLSHHLYGQLGQETNFPISLELHKVTERGNCLSIGDICDEFYDYQPNSLAWPIMSNKMKSIIDSKLTGLEHVEWKEIYINGKLDKKKYYIPMFTKELDTLNKEETVYVPSSGIVLKPCFSKEKTVGLSIFHGGGNFWKITTQIYVNEDIKKELGKAGIKELCFSKVKVI